MSRKKRRLIIFLSIVVCLMLFAAWYQYTYSMDEAVSFEVNAPDNTTKLLIATQGSEFKNEITKNVINRYEKDAIYIKVIDVSLLTGIRVEDYNAILLIHTWENWKPPVAVKLFIEEKGQRKDKIVVLTTSGEGSYKMEGIDAITGESKPENINPFTARITKRIDKLLYNNSNQKRDHD